MLLPASCNPNRKAIRLAAAYYMCPVSDIFTIASVLKNARSTAPMLMYQHSRSGVSRPGRLHIVGGGADDEFALERIDSDFRVGHWTIAIREPEDVVAEQLAAAIVGIDVRLKPHF